MENKQFTLALTKIRGVGRARYLKLLTYFGSPKSAWEANAEELRTALGGYSSIVEELLSTRKTLDIGKYHEDLSRDGINYVTLDEDDYPWMLKQIYDPPVLLFYRGSLRQHPLSISIVGSRKCTTYGKEAAKRLAQQLAARGINIVSGLARGIDTQAHHGALNAEGFTTAVLGSGIDVVYPAENHRLYQRIMETGLVLSEYHPGTKPDAGHFPARNRIISGLAQGIVVVEASEKSGSLITVDFALEQGRDIFAVPGNLNSTNSRGTNNLIRQGAKIIIDVDSILEEYAHILPPSQEDAEEEKRVDPCAKSSIQCALLRFLEDGPKSMDAIVTHLSLPIEKVNPMISLLEIDGSIIKISGNRIAKTVDF